MNIFGLFSLFGGLAMFLYGMNVMGSGLEKLGGGKFEQILEKLTSNPIKGVVLGAAVTAVIQSSSATTVMVVGFVNSGYRYYNGCKYRYDCYIMDIEPFRYTGGQLLDSTL